MIKNAEATLVAQVLEGRRECYRPLVEKYQKRIYILAYSLIGNSQEAQDITQEAFLLAYKDLHKLKDRAKFGSWLYGITRNLCYVSLRKKRIEWESFKAHHDQEITNVIPMKPFGEDGVDILDKLLTTLQALPEKYRALLHLKYLEEYSYKEISEMLDLPVDLIRSRLFEGRRLLREELDPSRRAEHDNS